MRHALAALAVAAVAAGCGTSSEAAGGTSIVVGNSQFGTMLFNSKKHAIYVFQRDSKNKSNCYGDCAALWPPVYTNRHAARR